MKDSNNTTQPATDVYNMLGRVIKCRNMKTMFKLQWWVKDGNNWCKTTWKYVLTRKHKGQRLKLDYA